MRKPLLAALLFPILTSAAWGQPRCPAPNLPALRGPNIFSEEQEVALGEAIAEQFQRDVRVIHDEEIESYLQRLGDRMAGYLPPSKIKYRFFVYDVPVVNAFGFAGGRIYISRKLIAAAQNEDELAGVVAHEIAHIVAHDSAIDITGYLRDILNVTSVGDQRDIVEKYHLLIENSRTKPKAFRRANREEQHAQLSADDLGLYLMTAAGYSAQIYSGFWDRMQDVKGKTGNWFSDAFGMTRPESRRLREMLRFAATVPANCIEKRTDAAHADFQKWQSVVVAYSGSGRKEALPALLSKLTLEPPLGGDLSYLKFSPDGKHVLAQDDSSIYVLSREPFRVRFRIDAPEAYAAHFTPDSQHLVFYDPSLRVEKWRLEDEEREAVKELVLYKGCLQTSLAPDGNFMACYTPEYHLTLIDVWNASTAFQKKGFSTPLPFEAARLWLAAILGDTNPRWVEMAFSPDSRYFLAGDEEDVIAIDLNTKAQIPLPFNLKKIMRYQFTFLSPDRVIGLAGMNGEKSTVVRFPSGDVVSELALGRANLFAPAKGDYVVLRPIAKHPVGVLNIATNKVFMANRKSAFDIYDRVYLSERRDGEIGLYSADNDSAVALASLPRGPLGRLRAASVSNDLKWLAVSERNRGAVWNLSNGQRVHFVRGFRGAYFDGKNGFFGDFPKFEEREREIARLDLINKQVTTAVPLKDSDASQYGPLIVRIRPAKERGVRFKDVVLEVSDSSNGTSLWTRAFPKEAPGAWIAWQENSLLLVWRLSASAAKDAIKQNPALNARQAAMKEKEGDYYVEAVEARTGKPLGQLLIETGKGSFQISRGFAAGDRLVISDTENRVLVYSFSTGELVARSFGAALALSPDRKWLCVQNEPGQILVHDLASMEKAAEYSFSSPVSLAEFSADGKRLFVLTSSQAGYFLDTSKLTAQQSAGAQP